MTSYKRHFRSHSTSSHGSTANLLPSAQTTPRSLPRRLRYLPHTVVLGLAGLALLSCSISLPGDRRPNVDQEMGAAISHFEEVVAAVEPPVNFDFDGASKGENLAITPRPPADLHPHPHFAPHEDATAVAPFATEVPASAHTTPPSEEPVPTSDLDPAKVASLAIEKLYARQSKTLEEARARYSHRSVRPPPPNFDKWFEYAQEHKCLIDDYEKIQRDFEPFYQIAEADPTYFGKMVNLGRELMLKDSKGMVTIKIEGGQTQFPNYTGTAFDGEWVTTLSKFARLIPDTEFLINGRDEPRVVFNARDPELLRNAANLTDQSPFHLSPVPTSDFFAQQSGCRTVKHGNTTVDAIEDVAFIRSSSSADFTTDLWPLLSMTKISPCFSDILYPGQYYYTTSGWSGKFDRLNEIPWAEKKAQLYWRGSSNGGHIIHDNYHKFSRFRLIKIAQNHSDRINAKMSGFYESHCTFECERDPIIEEYDIGGGQDPREEVYKYKYLLDVDGNTFSGRYLGLLRSGSLVFKATVFNEYFSDWLRPFEHYIPVKIDLSDLVEKVEWAIAHEEEARRIQETGMQFAEKVLTDDQNDCYFALVLLEWARLQNYAKEAAATGGKD